MPVLFRPARAEDVDAAVTLILSSGPEAFAYVFAVPGRAGPADFLARAFRDGAGEFGWRNHVVAECDGRVVAAGAGWSGRVGFAFMLAAARQILGLYGPLAGAGVIGRGLRCERVIPPPSRSVFYLAHLGVAADRRGEGIGAGLIAHLLAAARAGGFATAALDVSVANKRAEALYARLGFTVTGERRSTLRNAQGSVAGHRRMERVLSGGAPQNR